MASTDIRIDNKRKQRRFHIYKPVDMLDISVDDGSTKSLSGEHMLRKRKEKWHQRKWNLLYKRDK